MKKVLFALMISSAIVLAACGGGGGGDAAATLAPVPADYAGLTNPLGADAAAAGADVFKVNCESCHGPQGHGDGPAGAALDPAPKNLPDLAAQVGDDYLFWRVSTGKEGTSMVAWKGVLTDEQIWQAVAFIRTLK
ncbi:MAG: cytochrome c [Anaerolineaceae bacterium]|jgi:high-affinity iron transporter|nr:MAG: cytochrome c [Anaerolineaceae bacterium]